MHLENSLMKWNHLKSYLVELTEKVLEFLSYINVKNLL